MIFYYGMTNFHILSILLHKILYREDKKAILYVSSFLNNNQPELIENLKNCGLFEDVGVFIESDWKREELTEQDEKKEIDRIAYEAEEQVGNVLKKCEEINICADHAAIGMYLIKNKITYNYFEEACGVLLDEEIMLKCIRTENITRYNIIDKVGINGANDFVPNRYGNLKKQGPSKPKSKDVHFCVEELLKEISKSDMEKILKVFSAKKIEIDQEKKSLLLTWHYHGQNYMSLEDQRLYFSLITDYFTDNDEQLVVKPHPSDVKDKYDKWFSDAIILYQYMPSELLPYCFDDKFQKAITNWSTSVFSLSNMFDKIINFDVKMDTTFKEIDNYYTIVNILKDNKNELQPLNLYNINELLLTRLLDYYFKDYEKYYTINILEERDYNLDGIYIVNDNLVTYDKPVINLNPFGNHSKAENIIKIQRIGEQTYSDYIGIYNFNLSTEINYKKKLKYSNYEMKTSKISLEDYVEGIVSNMEKHAQLNNKYDKEEVINKKRREFLEWENGNLSYENQNIKSEIEKLKELNQNLQNKSTELEKYLYESNAEIERILNSKVWKLTHPTKNKSK